MRAAEKAIEIVEEPEPAGGANVRGVGLMTLGHFMDDVYPGFIPPLLPFFIEKFGLSFTLAGVLSTVLSLSTSVGQFSFGWLADRVGRRTFVVAGPLAACVFLSLAPLSSSYARLLLLIVCGGMGVAAFHPCAASLTGAYAGKRKSLAMSVFAAAGSLGFAAGPMLVLWVITTFGAERSYVAMIPGLITVAVLAVASPKVPACGAAKEEAGASLRGNRRVLVLLWFVAVVRAAVIMGFENFVPVMIRSHGGSLLSGGTAISLFLLCGSVGGVVGGYISDRVDPRKVLLFSSVAPVPLFLAFLGLGGHADLVALGLAGAFVFAAVPVTIVLAQETAPGRASTASSLVMGVAWGVGGTASAGIGYLADIFGVERALFGLALILLLSAPCVPFLPARKGQPKWVGLR